MSHGVSSSIAISLDKIPIIASPGDQSCAAERCAGAAVAPGSDRGAWRQRLEKCSVESTHFLDPTMGFNGDITWDGINSWMQI